MGLLYLPAIVSVGHYFKKKRALATGIAVCGSGVGGFVFAPLSEFLIEMYTWKGAMWIISAICLNGVVVAALLRPLETGSTQKGRNDREQDDEQNKESSKSSEPEKKICCDVSTMFEFSLLKSPTFLVYGCSCFLCMLGREARKDVLSVFQYFMSRINESSSPEWVTLTILYTWDDPKF